MKSIIKISYSCLIAVLITIGCSDEPMIKAEESMVKQELNREALSDVITNRKDFNQFINLHFQNILAANALQLEESIALQKIQSDMLNKNFNKKEAMDFIRSKNFKPEALNHYNSLVVFLNSNYVFNKEDLDYWLNYYIDKITAENGTISRRNNPAAAAYYVISCDTYCTNRSWEVYPNDPTFRAVWYAGCMDGCKNGPNAQ